jgi:hypothetical protein
MSKKLPAYILHYFALQNDLEKILLSKEKNV